MTVFIMVVAFAWSIYCSFREIKPEYITLVALTFYFVYYILGGWLFPDVYFPYLNEKNYAYAVFFPVVISALLLASFFGNTLLLTMPSKRRIENKNAHPLLGFYFLAFLYSMLIVVFIVQSDFGIVGGSGDTLQNVNTRTSLVYENKLYSYVSYAVFYTLPLISLVFFEYEKKKLAISLLVLCAIAISITGQKSSLVLVLLTVFFYFLLKFGLLRASKLAVIPFILVVFSLISIVLIWNQDTLTGSLTTNIYLSFKGILERVTLTGTRLVSEYIYLVDTLQISIDKKPSGQPISMFVYDMIESDGLVGSKPAHISLIQYLTNGMPSVFIATFLLYFFYFFVKFVVEIELVDSRFLIAINSWILVSIVNATITDSFMHISAWLFSVLFMLGALIAIGYFPRLLNGSSLINVPFKSLILNVVSIVAFLYFIQGLVRGLL